MSHYVWLCGCQCPSVSHGTIMSTVLLHKESTALTAKVHIFQVCPKNNTQMPICALNVLLVVAIVPALQAMK